MGVDGREVARLLESLRPGRDGRKAFASLDKAMGGLGPLEKASAVARLGELAAAPHNRNRSWCIQLIAQVAFWHRHIWKPARPIVVQRELLAVVPMLSGFVADPDPMVRRVAPYAICEIVEGESGLAGLIRDRAEAEHDALSLAGQVRALDELGHATPPGSTSTSWFASWLSHPSPPVRLAAVGAVGRRASSQVDNIDLASVAVDAFAAAGSGLWEGSPWKPRSHPGPVLWVARRLAEHPHEGARLALEAFACKDKDIRSRAASAAAVVLNGWRLPIWPLWAALAKDLQHPEWIVRQNAAEVLATGGAAVRPHADALFDAVERDDKALHALAALARLGDPRAVPVLSRCIGGSQYWPYTIVVSELLICLREYAGALLPVIREVMREPLPQHGDQYLIALASWGPASSEAVPELVNLLHTKHAARSCVALGCIGPAAVAAVDTLKRLALGTLRPPTFAHESPEWYGRQHAAWAHWRVTGDPAVALQVLGQAARRGLGHPMLPHLAQLGPLAASHAADVRRLLDLPGGWSRIEAAHAWWRITGDPGPAIPVLLNALQPLRARQTSAALRTAVRYLGAIGRPAQAALPLLEAALQGERRHIDPRSRRAMRDDDALVEDATAARDLIQRR